MHGMTQNIVLVLEVLANCLKKTLPEVMSNIQSAFVLDGSSQIHG